MILLQIKIKVIKYYNKIIKQEELLYKQLLNYFSSKFSLGNLQIFVIVF